jgi:UPF0042 nucleotide-binding protein
VRLLVVSGLSGAGKSTALRALEDSGFYCVDNLPVPMLPRLLELLAASKGPRLPVAVGIDARETDHLDRFPEVLAQLREDGHEVEVVFLQAPTEVLVRRYSETRRRHPMGPLPDGIERERVRLSALRDRATTILDTSATSARQLRQLVRERWASAGALTVNLMSFGFKNGVPLEADLVLDARFLANPFDVDELRPLSGHDAAVERYVLEQDDATALLERLEDLVRFMVPRTAREGRSYLTVAVGCTGGQHRSVALIEALHARLRARAPAAELPVRLGVRHRDVAIAPTGDAHD